MMRWLWLSLLVILLDQATKQIAEALLTYAQSVNVLPIFSFTLLYNKGAAFSFLSEQAGWQRWFFILLALGVSMVLVAWLRRLKQEERWTAVALALIIGGALGNVIDRILFGQVIDFLHFHYGDHYFPAFNVADSAISIGVAVMLLDALVLSHKRSIT
jgi:signal peptidase II